jgi:hypothetical protein
MGKPHKHAELIKAWADGAEIEYRDRQNPWNSLPAQGDWDEHPYFEYRIKPAVAGPHKPKPDVMTYYYVNGDNELFRWGPLNKGNADLRIIVDGETGKLKSAEVL